MKLPKLAFLVPFITFFVLAWLLVIRANIHEGRAAFLMVICLFALLLTSERYSARKEIDDLKAERENREREKP